MIVKFNIKRRNDFVALMTFKIHHETMIKFTDNHIDIYDPSKDERFLYDREEIGRFEASYK